MTVSRAVDWLRQLLDAFNRGSLDVPDGLFDRQTVFRLNGAAYHESLGRSPDDPLVRLIGCGPAAYRFNATALQRAFETVKISCGPMQPAGLSADGLQHLSGRGSLRGRLRGAHALGRSGASAPAPSGQHTPALGNPGSCDTSFETTCILTVTVDARGSVKEFDVTMADDDLRAIKDARARS